MDWGKLCISSKLYTTKPWSGGGKRGRGRAAHFLKIRVKSQTKSKTKGKIIRVFLSFYIIFNTLTSLNGVGANFCFVFSKRIGKITKLKNRGKITIGVFPFAPFL
jgi:hypothetical protein